MRRTPTLISVVALIIGAIGAADARAQYTFTTLDVPGASTTFAFGIYDENVVGTYFDSGSVPHGFIFDGSNYSSFDAPPGAPTVGTYGRGITNILSPTIVGYTSDAVQGTSHGFVYNGGVGYNDISPPQAGPTGTLVLGIRGKVSVGEYKDAADNVHGFIFDGSNYSTLDDPLGTNGTYVAGFYAGKFVGGYYDTADHGYLYDGSTFTTIDDPLGVGTNPSAVFGNTVVGYYRDSSNHDHGFVFNGSSFTTVDNPAGTRTRIRGIYGSTLVGDFLDGSGTHGFIATVPEPASVGLLGIAILALIRRGRNRQ